MAMAMHQDKSRSLGLGVTAPGICGLGFHDFLLGRLKTPAMQQFNSRCRSMPVHNCEPYRLLTPSTRPRHQRTFSERLVRRWLGR
jgi:hypothetical protein